MRAQDINDRINALLRKSEELELGFDDEKNAQYEALVLWPCEAESLPAQGNFTNNNGIVVPFEVVRQRGLLELRFLYPLDD